MDIQNLQPVLFVVIIAYICTQIIPTLDYIIKDDTMYLKTSQIDTTLTVRLHISANI